MATFNYVYLKCCSDPTVIVKPCSPVIDGFSGGSFTANTIYYDNDNYCWSAFTSSTVVNVTRVNVTLNYFTFNSGVGSCFDCTQTHTSDCSSLPLPDSKCVTWEISQTDLDNATGNSDPSKNGYVFVTYTSCYGEDKTKIYGSRAIEGDCILDPFAVLIYYFKNNAIVATGLSSAQYMGAECECVCGTCPQCGVCAIREYCLDTNNVIPYDGSYSYAGYYNGKFYYTGTTGVIYFDSQKWCLSDTLGGSCVLFGSNPCSSGCPDLCKDELNPGLCVTNTTTISCIDVDFDVIFNCNVETTTSTTTIIPTTTTTTTVFDCNMVMVAVVQPPKVGPRPTLTTTTTIVIPNNCFSGEVTYTLFEGHFQCASTRKLIDCNTGYEYYVSEALEITSVNGTTQIGQGTTFVAIINGIEGCVTYEGPSLISTNAILDGIIEIIGGCEECLITPTPSPTPTITPTPTETRFCPLPTPTLTPTKTKNPVPTRAQIVLPDCNTKIVPPTPTPEPLPSPGSGKVSLPTLPAPSSVTPTPTPTSTDLCPAPSQTPFPPPTPSKSPKPVIPCLVVTPTPTGTYFCPVPSQTPLPPPTKTPRPSQLYFQNIFDCCTNKVVGNWNGLPLPDGVYYFINLNDETAQISPPTISLTGCYRLSTSQKSGIKSFYGYKSHIPSVDCNTCLVNYSINCVTTTTIPVTTTSTSCGIFCNQRVANITFGVNVSTSLASGIIGLDTYVKTCDQGPFNSIYGTRPIVEPDTITFPILSPIIVTGTIYHYTLSITAAFKILAGSLGGRTIRISIGTGNYGDCSYGSYTFTIPPGGLLIDTWFSILTDISNFTVTSIGGQILISIDSSTDTNFAYCINNGINSCNVFSCSGNTIAPSPTPYPTPTPTPQSPTCTCYTLYNASAIESCEAYYQQCSISGTNTPISSIMLQPLETVHVCSYIIPYQSCCPDLIVTNNGNCLNSIICGGSPAI